MCRLPSRLARVTAAESAELRPEIPDWQRLEHDGIARLERVFHVPSFADTLAFTNRVGALAEEEGHHPTLLTEWGRVTVTWWTHKIRGLHRNDFIMAAKTESLCPACHTANPPTNKLCHQCGGPLTGRPSTPQFPSTGRHSGFRVSKIARSDFFPRSSDPISRSRNAAFAPAASTPESSLSTPIHKYDDVLL